MDLVGVIDSPHFSLIVLQIMSDLVSTRLDLTLVLTSVLAIFTLFLEAHHVLNCLLVKAKLDTTYFTLIAYM
jgi:hypothetical protein